MLTYDKYGRVVDMIGYMEPWSEEENVIDDTIPVALGAIVDPVYKNRIVASSTYHGAYAKQEVPATDPTH